MRILNKIFALCFVAMLLASTSCNDFFEVPYEDVEMTEDTIFSRILYTRGLLTMLYNSNMKTVAYNYGNTSGNRLRHNCPDILTDCMSGFPGNTLDAAARFYSSQLSASEGSVVNGYPSNTLMGEYTFQWRNIRSAHTIIGRVDEVPDATVEEKERIKGECYVYLGMTYFEMMRRFGGVPLVKNRLDDASEFSVPRSSLQETLDYIIECLNKAIQNEYLPAQAVGTEFGHYTKAFAYGLKAKALLTAASPLFNTGTPFMSLGENNNLICFGNYDPERWNAAAIAATEAINYCEANGYAIIDDYDPVTNYIVATKNWPSSSQPNTELIYGWNAKITTQDNAAPMKYIQPRGQGGWNANMPTHNLVEMYRKSSNGSFINWNAEITTSPNEPYEVFEDLEPRFQATIAANGGDWKTYSNGNFTDYKLQYYNGASGVTNGRDGNASQPSQLFSYNMRKYIHGHESQIGAIPDWWVIQLNMRLTDLYLMRAEALNEYNSGPSGTCEADLNKVLNRAGMSVPTGMGYQEMKSFIERERAIEFAFEDQRYMDLKRTLRAYDVLNFTAYDARCTKNADNTYTYKKVAVQERTFQSHYYLWPFPQKEINKQYGIIQNPGW